MHSSASDRRRASSRLRAGLGTALALCATLPFAAPAHASDLLVPSGAGMTMPAGIVETTNGSVWVSDEALGVCRVQTDAAQLVASSYCRPEPPEAGPQRPGPATPFQMAFDPASSNFFVAEGDSAGSGVWRMHWDAATDTIDAAERIVNTNGNRVFALALGTDPSGTVYVDFNGRDDATVRRIENAGATAPVAHAATSVVGIAGDGGVASMANLDGALYLAEAAGVTRIATPGTGAPVAQSVPGFPAGLGSVPNALVADHARGRVYAGTANVSGLDRVDVLTADAGAVATYETGFALVTGLGLRSDGALLVGDDPPASAGAPESLGQSRLWQVPLHAVSRPTVTITGGAQAYSNATSATFTFSSAADATFFCRLNDAAFTLCRDYDGPTGSQFLSALADGVHVFEVRAGDDGQAARQTFVVDTVAPVAQIDNPAADRQFTGDAIRMRFSANEFGVTYACTLDGGYVHGCDAPKWLRGFDIGQHVFTVTPTDLAGNIGAAVSWRFERLAPPPPPAPAPEPARPDNSGPGSQSSGPGSAPAQAKGSSVAARCRGLRSARRGRFAVNAGGRGRLLTARIAPPAGARYVKITLRSRRGFAQTLARGTVSGTRVRDVRAILTPVEAARLRMRGSSVTVAYGTCAGTTGLPSTLTATPTISRGR
jgi:hypothetical protein